MYRHPKPYQCTLSCDERFDILELWEAHEIREYTESMVWVCVHLHHDTSIDMRRFTDIGGFKDHLIKDHYVDDIAAFNTDRFCQGAVLGPFWCGMCQMTVETDERGAAAWSLKSYHIIRHHNGCTPDQWVSQNEVQIANSRNVWMDCPTQVSFSN